LTLRNGDNNTNTSKMNYDCPKKDKLAIVAYVVSEYNQSNTNQESAHTNGYWQKLYMLN